MSLPFVLTALLLWAGLIAFVMLALNRYRTFVEQRAESGASAVPAPPVETVIAYIGPRRLVRKGRR